LNRPEKQFETKVGKAIVTFPDGSAVRWCWFSDFILVLVLGVLGVLGVLAANLLFLL
jgi:hypothetical protein